jgi:hypothetical protein
MPSASKPSASLAFNNERTVSVPQDDSSLRFALPPTPVASSSSSPQPDIAPVPSPVAPSTQQIAQATPLPVVPASYASADSNSIASASGPDPSSNGPWRQPVIPASLIVAARTNSLAPSLAAATPPQAMAPPETPSIPVTLRAVPSPPVDTTVSQPPRIRFPSYDAMPQATRSSGGPVQQAAFTLPPSAMQSTIQPQFSQPQMVTIPLSGAVPGLGPAVMPTMNVASQPQSASAASPDGFRPRSTLR